MSAVPLLCTLAGCGITGPLTDKVCTNEARAGISISVRDSITDVSAGRNSRIIASSGAFADTSHETSIGDLGYGLVYERAGTYVVTVEQVGYKLWTKSGVEVTKGDCHVNGVSLTARLQK